MRHLSLLILSVVMVGCFPPDYVEVDHHAVYAESRPPEPKDEENLMGDAPGDAYVWVSGHWWWTGNGWAWVGGRWAVPPAGGHVYISSGWIVIDGRYRYVPGRWSRPGYVPRYQYVHPRRHYPYRYAPHRRR